MEIILGFALGIIGSIIASKVFRKDSYSNKPILEISQCLIEKDDNNKLRVKIINKTDNEIINVQFILYGTLVLDDEGKLKRLIELSKKEIPYISKFHKEDKDFDFAHQIELSHIDENLKIVDVIKSGEYHHLRLLVKAECPYYGSITVENKIYNNLDKQLKDNCWSFELGNSNNCKIHN